MKLKGTMTLDNECNLYSVGIPVINLWTQGADYHEGLAMAKDWIETMYEDLEFNIIEDSSKDGTFFLDSSDPKLIGIILKANRERIGLSLPEAAKMLGFANHNSIYAYERGTREPSISNFGKILKAYGVDFEILDADEVQKKSA